MAGTRWTIILASSGAGIVGLLAATMLIGSNASADSALVTHLETVVSERGGFAASSRFDLSEAVLEYISIGTNEGEAAAALRSAGFTVTQIEKPERSPDADMETVGVLVRPGGLLWNYSINIVLGIKDGKVSTVEAWAAYRSL